MGNVLISWIGHADLKAPSETDRVGIGPLAQAITMRAFDEIAILFDYPKDRVADYLGWLSRLSTSRLHPYYESLSGPTQFGEIYETTVRVVSDVLKRHGSSTELTFHLSPGTPAMAAVWIILAKTRFPAELIESSKEHGVRTASVPFDISAEFIPDLLRKPDRELARLSVGLPPEAPEFNDIIHRSAVMKRIIAQARLVAPRSVPVLIEGESGTGKELLARAIHRASPRREKPFVAVNCGAIPSELLEAELFGYVKGAFTGAVRSHAGYFEKSSTGTLFLDEIGELPPAAQVKILRVLQEKQVTRVGSTSPVTIDLRLLAATNRKLIEEVANGRFRPDLFYRLAVAVLQLPPLRERLGDLGLLIDQLLEQINDESTHEPGFSSKKLSASARNLLLQHSWPGNVRELFNTLLRAAIWSPGTAINVNDIAAALLPVSAALPTEILNKPLGEGLDLPKIISTVARHYLSRALEEARDNKTKAAALVGLPSYQTLTNWLKRYGVKP
jgi:DNA-binding NtrC family response regulator